MKIMTNEFANESFSPGDVDRMTLSVIKVSYYLLLTVISERLSRTYVTTVD